MPWRYQPVYTEDEGGRSYSICEVYFDEAGNLTQWTVNPAIEPRGEDWESLSEDLVRMLVDTYSWMPIRFEDIKAGVVFQKRISMDDRQDIAAFIEHSTGAFKRAEPPKTN
jgi:hypothetical protein